MRSFLTCGLLLSCAACTAPLFHQAYPGPMLAPEEHARIVTVSDARGRTWPVISCVDGKDTSGKSILAGDYPPEAFVLAGRHYIAVFYNLHTSWTEGALWLDAQPGRTYIVTWERAGRNIRFFLVDAETGRAVGGVVGSEPNPGPEEQVCVPRLSF
jgi:hypothetical protein